ncbi:MAG TPA: right-handed parallel beta-helix repeat-containing protein [Terriglobia bacterium]|nr:right-handed parallel beta-helix repeat-containing protein [Terriglobia bacterium]
MKGTAGQTFRSKLLTGVLLELTLGVACAFYGIATPNNPPANQAHQPSSRSGPIVIKGEKGTVINHLQISSATGDCVTIEDSTDITIKNSEIGPCLGSGIRISGGSGINIYDNYIHPEAPLSACCDRSDGIFATSTTNLTIQGNVIAYGETNIEVGKAATVKVIGNFLLNPRNTLTGSRGQNFQSWNGSRDVLVENNYALASLDTDIYKFPENQEDSINFGETEGVIARNNYISGGHSRSGCGLMADIGANNVTFQGNVLVNTGQCGIGIADGTNQVVKGNRVINRTPVNGGGNTAIYVWKQYAPPCGPVTVTDNIATQIKVNGTESSFWNGGGCGSVRLQNNVWGSRAVRLLTPIQKRLPAPLIPPQPYRYSIPSPFSSQAGLEGSNAWSRLRRGPIPPAQAFPQSTR